MRIPLRYTYATCSVMLATIKSGPSGARSGSQTYWPGFKVTVSGETRTPSVKVSAEMKARSRANKATTVTRNENKDFTTVNVQVTSPRDAPDRSRLSILFDPVQAGLCCSRQPARNVVLDAFVARQQPATRSQENRARGAL